MRRVAVVACVLGMTLMTACGGDDGDVKSAGQALVGTWVLELDNGFECLRGFTFGADGAFEHDYVCKLNGGSLGLDAIVGSYEVKDDRIGLSATHAICEGVSKEKSWAGFTFLQDQQRLKIVTDSGGLILV